jgi:2,4-dienoyl-CoA reductase-like NADH-dependent reductase (Old Yellow Enzyme family)
MQNLFSETKLGPLRLNNRLAVAPMTRISADKDGSANERMARYYERFARGGFGLIITEGTYLDLSFSQGYLNQPGIASTAQADAWRPVVSAVHEHGAKIVLQLMHAGALGQGNERVNETIAPSAVTPKGEQLSFYHGSGPYRVPTEITREQIAELVDSFADAALRAKQVGFDGVEIHGANGYLLDQFLTSYTNQRDDEYGGTTANRVRLIVEVVEAVRKTVGNDFAVGVRISQGKVNDYEHKWADSEDDARIIFEALAKARPDFLHVTEYDASAPAFGEGDSLATLAHRYGALPVIANGKLDEPSQAASLVESRHIDVIALGKAALANPDWPEKVQCGLPLKEFDATILHPVAHVKDEELP